MTPGRRDDEARPGSVERAAALYEQARGLPADARLAFLHEECGEDHELRDELLSLLGQAEGAEAFFGALEETLLSTSFPSELAGSARAAGMAAASEAVGDEGADGSSSEDLPIGHEIAHFRIVERVARGGMGTVYRARDLRLGRDVALKLLPPHVVARAADRLLLEASAAAALEHPNLCTVYEVGETEQGRPYLAMAFYDGETLAVALRRGPLPPGEAVRVARAMAGGLAAVHGRGIVHGDIKPANVMLTATGEVKLLDFGLASMGEVAPARPGATFGTLAYMSPEQVRGEALDARTDLWSLGVVLHEMLTGARPFRGGDAGAMLHAILYDDPGSVREGRPGIAEPLADVVERLLAKDREARYARASELLAVLERLAPTTREVAPRPTPRARIPRRALRRPAALWGAAGLLVVVAVIAAWPPGVSDEATGGIAREGNVQAVGGALPGARARIPVVAAYELYQRGSDQALLRSESGVRQAVEYFEEAIAADSNYAEAHAGLARMYLVLAGRDNPGVPIDDLHVLAERAAMKALALDDSLADAHAALGLIRQYAASDFAGAEAELGRAIALDPTRSLPRQWLAQLYLQTGRAAEALAEARGAFDLDPLSPSAHAEVAHALLANGRPEEALSQLERIAAVQPPLLRASAYRAQAHALMGMWPEAVAALRSNAEAGIMGTPALYGYVLARGGRREEAARVRAGLLERWRRGEIGAFDLVLVDAGLGDLDQAFAWLDRWMEEGASASPAGYPMMPILHDLREDPRFERVRNRLGLPKR